MRRATAAAVLVAMAALMTRPWTARAFPDGAPVDACVKPRPNQPYHGQARPGDPRDNPFSIVASDDRYGPGSKITVTIEGGRGEPFRGFFVQARDAATGAWLGTWEENPPYTNGLPECAAITHGDNRDKARVTLTWQAPRDAGDGGQVYFTGSVVQDYATFWVDIVSRVA
ncbi:reelin domain-containing protein 1 [Schistocerca gregaria]|uniref:reelin domain-containing protein 1 n=1 Tax=Schistocerca gregaria TaxID=7010 RepID=UPI00211E20CB|nr:reelin domain-containing protein 1 [Schistocerca gregaria]